MTKEALTQPHRTYLDATSHGESQITALNKALKEMMRKELLDAR